MSLDRAYLDRMEKKFNLLPKFSYDCRSLASLLNIRFPDLKHARLQSRGIIGQGGFMAGELETRLTLRVDWNFIEVII